MTTYVTLPTAMSMSDWADQVVLDLDNFGSFGKLLDQDWQSWAVQFLNNPSLTNNIPSPYMFSEWKHWAERFCEELS